MKPLIVSIAAALLCACSGGSGAPLSFSVATTTAGSPRALVVASGIDVQRVQLNIGRLKLEGGGAPSGVAVARQGSDDGDGGVGEAENEVEVRQGPFVVDLDATALNGAVTRVFDADVPAGTYREFRFEIFPGAALQNASAIVTGTIDGQPFTFTSALVAAQKKEGV